MARRRSADSTGRPFYSRLSEVLGGVILTGSARTVAPVSMPPNWDGLRRFGAKDGDPK